VTVRTNKGRRLEKDKRKRSRAPRVTPLMSLGMWVHLHGHDISGAPRDCLEEALISCDKRLIALQARDANARTRAQMLWLGRWCMLINCELSGLRT
jgi:hypothetical protein